MVERPPNKTLQPPNGANCDPDSRSTGCPMKRSLLDRCSRERPQDPCHSPRRMRGDLLSFADGFSRKIS